MTKGEPHICVSLYYSYRKFPEQINCSIDEIYGLTSTRFVAVSHRDLTTSVTFLPGVILAFNETQKLIQEEGEEIASLVLVDSRVFYDLERLTKPFYGYCNSAGLFGEELEGYPSTG